MNVLILEDELPAADKLVQTLLRIDPTIHIVAKIRSVAKGKTWLAENPEPDLILSDIQLLDGLAFELYQAHPVQCAIIFTTAFDAYSLKAFEVNSIDYLLKPISEDKLRDALNKVEKRSSKPLISAQDLDQLAQMLLEKKQAYKSRFLVRLGQRIKSIPTTEIAYFFTEDKVTFLKAQNGERFPINQSLDELEALLDPVQFFRVNRKFMITHSAVKNIHPHFKGRLKLELEPLMDEDLVVSAEKTPLLKVWLDT